MPLGVCHAARRCPAIRPYCMPAGPDFRGRGLGQACGHPPV